ncbi:MULTISPECIES: methionyl-tRNA formyltransferase [unclassified Treponema]|uniref:methionyl-tRNA formyltransferase n=1 Tax=unclassified Treponema TaxID=2638727 RepID=UPI0020A2B2A2|nr:MULTISPECIES: formyltransferase family protein [unclassified Treponema]UTC68211.1 methionyl-tRNA formyltransferase [Treponema sp. OMZ 789]UTC70931.1 methionyl-tRNA formyltransferase [Treponema sp. OMZ 790]UTC73671.1 methionyl-tRNA formyltransferase [Treponema sp. OMZ 791]
MKKPLSICIGVSGGLGLTILQYLLCRHDISISAVFTNKKSTEIISFVHCHKIPCFIGNPKNNATSEFLCHIKRPDILLTVNYIFIIEKDLILFPLKYAINIHGSLLPKYRGRTPHVWSIINNEKIVGVTAHFITETCDEGDVLQQIIIPIKDTDTGGSILKQYKIFYPQLIDSLILNIKQNSLKPIKQNEKLATYFPKRVASDGLIDWSWQKERIYNWVRAMAPPEYPGAFFYYKGKKIIVQKIEYSDMGFNYSDENGKIYFASNSYFVIKTPNGCILAYIYKEEEVK